MNTRISLLFIFILVMAGPPVSLADEVPDGMVKIPGGCYMMGTNKDFGYKMGWHNEREQPSHKVCLDSFYLDKYEVSQKKWEEIKGYNNSPIKDPDFPVSEIDWMEAKNYCARTGNRLPTEAEWEYAARAGSQTDNPWGDGIDRDYLWYGGNSYRKLWPVGRKKPNAWGVHDMMGSVWEWTSDWFSHTYYQESPVDNPKGPKRNSWRVIRGASWVDDEEFIHVTVRYEGMSDPTEDFWVGVRCARSIPKTPK
jgi:sulfatase modifying factor 1